MLFVGIIVFAQKLELTPTGLVSVDDNSKNFIVLEFPGKSQAQLFKATTLLINTKYNNPKFVTTELENEQLVINATSPQKIKIKGLMRFDVNYNAVFSFKDGKVKLELNIKEFERFISGMGREVQGIVGYDMGISRSGVFNNKGKLINENAKESTELFANEFVENIKSGITKNLSGSEW